MELQFPLILDGATGTQLQKRGYTGKICAEQWVLENPDAILAIQKDYIEAGSQVVYAPTFGANGVKLAENGIRGQTTDYNQRLAALSRQAAGDSALVAGDLAPTGKFLFPVGDYTFEKLVDVYTEQAAALEEAGVDLFVIETTMTLPEARAAILAVKSVSEKPVFVTFTCDASGRTLTGTDVTAALIVLQSMGADAFGLNCSVGPQEMLVQIRRLAEYAQVPLIAKPNAGMPQTIDGQTVYLCSPEEFAEIVPQLADAGVGIFGGCCGTTAEHIKALHDAAAAAKIRTSAPLHADQIVLATEKEVFLLPQDAECDEMIEAGEDLEDDIDDACDETDGMIGIRFTEEEDLEYFSESQYAITQPLCVSCDDAGLLEQVLRLYQGRAMYTGSLPAEALAPLQKKYGLVVPA